MDQLDIFRPGPALPAGFRYQEEVISESEERELLARIRQLPFREFQFHGYVGKRRTVSFGWRYEFATERLYRANEIPDFLLAARAAAAGFAAMTAEELQQVLVTEYGPGAAIGWHRDKPVFGNVVGLSLLSACVFRLRRKQGGKWERASLTAAPRSAYLLSGAARTEWEHSIPAVASLRYSITFRNLRQV